ncbi:hypothetical protein MKX01_027370 [Papaver californicum]|nr:hypothetical protein MKX01_027370 [Papaver californicum]
MQQQFMQMQPMMAAGYNPNNLTTEQIQQYLEENKRLIIKILEDRNNGNVSELAENQERLERNLTYLNAIASYQPQQPTMHAWQFPNATVQQGAHNMQHQQAHALTPQLLMAARTSMLCGQQPMFPLQQQQAMHSQLGMNSGFNYNGLRMMHSDQGGMGGGNGSIGAGFPDLGGTRLYRYDPKISTLNKLQDDNKGMKCVYNEAIPQMQSIVSSKDLGETNVTSLKDFGKATKARNGGTGKIQEKPIRSRGTKRKKNC